MRLHAIQRQGSVRAEKMWQAYNVTAVKQIFMILTVEQAVPLVTATLCTLAAFSVMTAVAFATASLV